MSFAEGFQTPGLTCDGCGMPFALSFGLPPMPAVKSLSDPFQATCPLCQHQATYPKSAIQTLVATQRQ